MAAANHVESFTTSELTASTNLRFAQELNPTALTSLMAHTAQLRSKHLDMQFMRRRRQKNMTGATRQWFVNADLWLAGTATAAVGEAGAPTDAQVCHAARTMATVSNMSHCTAQSCT